MRKITKKAQERFNRKEQTLRIHIQLAKASLKSQADQTALDDLAGLCQSIINAELALPSNFQPSEEEMREELAFWIHTIRRFPTLPKDYLADTVFFIASKGIHYTMFQALLDSPVDTGDFGLTHPLLRAS